MGLVDGIQKENSRNRSIKFVNKRIIDRREREGIDCDRGHRPGVGGIRDSGREKEANDDNKSRERDETRPPLSYSPTRDMWVDVVEENRNT